MEQLISITKRTVDRTKLMSSLRKKKENIEKRLSQLHGIHYKDEVFVPLAESLLPHVNRKKFEVMGPFGLGCHISIIFYDGKEWVKDKKSKSITFNPWNLFDTGSLRVVDERTDTGRYSKDTIGYANGLHHHTYEVPATMTFKEIADKWINKRRTTK